MSALAADARRPPALAASLRRAGEREIDGIRLELRAGRPAGDDWLPLTRIADGDVLEDLLARTGRAAATRRRDVQGTWLLEALAGGLVGAVVRCVLMEGCAPELSGAIAVRLDASGDLGGVAFAAERSVALGGAPAAAGPGTVAGDDRAALWAMVRAGLVAHLGPAVAGLRPVTRRGPRALWASVEDACSGQIMWIGDALGLGDLARIDATLLLDGSAPLTGRPRFVDLAHRGGVERTRIRNGCCLSYAREGRDGRGCFTCPLTTDAERVRRLEENA